MCKSKQVLNEIDVLQKLGINLFLLSNKNAYRGPKQCLDDAHPLQMQLNVFQVSYVYMFAMIIT